LLTIAALTSNSLAQHQEVAIYNSKYTCIYLQQLNREVEGVLLTVAVLTGKSAKSAIQKVSIYNN